MVTLQYVYQGSIESQRLELNDAVEYAQALKNKGVSVQIILQTTIKALTMPVEGVY